MAMKFTASAGPRVAAEIPEYPVILEWLKKFDLYDEGLTKE